MMRYHRLGAMLALTASLLLMPTLASAQQPYGHNAEAQPQVRVQPALDPLVRDVLIALVASLLREAAESPDPLATLGEALNRKLVNLMSSPAAPAMIEGLLSGALKDVPAELREPLGLFAASVLAQLRRDLARQGR